MSEITTIHEYPVIDSSIQAGLEMQQNSDFVPMVKNENLAPDLVVVDSKVFHEVLGRLSPEQEEVIQEAVQGKLEERKAIDLFLEESASIAILPEPEQASNREALAREQAMTDKAVKAREILDEYADKLAQWYLDGSMAGLISQTYETEKERSIELINELAQLAATSSEINEGISYPDVDHIIAEAKRESLIIFERSCIAASTEIAHFTPVSALVAESGVLSGKSDHGITTTNNSASSKGLHFTSLAFESSFKPGFAGYKGYALGGSKHAETQPGAFVTTIGQLVGQGYDRLGVRFAGTVEGSSSAPIIMDLAITDQDDRSKVAIPLENFDYISLTNLDGSESKKDTIAEGIYRSTDDLKQKLLDDLDAGVITEAQFSGEISTARNIARIALNSEMLKGVIGSLPEQRIYQSMAEYAETRPTARTGEMIIPLKKAETATGLYEEYLDGEGFDKKSTSTFQYAVVAA